MSDSYYQNVYTQEHLLGTAGECRNRERTTNCVWTVRVTCQCPLTVKHILIECTDFRDIRNKEVRHIVF